MSKRNIIHWSYEDLNMRVETQDAMTPEAIETLAHKTGREFLEVFHDVYNATSADGELAPATDTGEDIA